MAQSNLTTIAAILKEHNTNAKDLDSLLIDNQTYQDVCHTAGMVVREVNKGNFELALCLAEHIEATWKELLEDEKGLIEKQLFDF